MMHVHGAAEGGRDMAMQLSAFISSMQAASSFQEIAVEKSK